eukprot:2314396-Rhodomonas_salina.1
MAMGDFRDIDFRPPPNLEIALWNQMDTLTIETKESVLKDIKWVTEALPISINLTKPNPLATHPGAYKPDGVTHLDMDLVGRALDKLIPSAKDTIWIPLESWEGDYRVNPLNKAIGCVDHRDTRKQNRTCPEVELPFKDTNIFYDMVVRLVAEKSVSVAVRDKWLVITKENSKSLAIKTVEEIHKEKEAVDAKAKAQRTATAQSTGGQLRLTGPTGPGSGRGTNAWGGGNTWNLIGQTRGGMRGGAGMRGLGGGLRHMNFQPSTQVARPLLVLINDEEEEGLHDKAAVRQPEPEV